MSDSNPNKNIIDPIEINEAFTKKRLARILAVQSVYCHYALKEEREFKYSIHDVMTSYKNSEMAEEIDDADEKRLIEICKKVESDSERIDTLISEFLDKNWKINRLPLLVLSVLRSAIAEYLLRKRKLDYKVLINEYVEIAKLFNHEGESGFVNKVLDSAFKKLENSF